MGKNVLYKRTADRIRAAVISDDSRRELSFRLLSLALAVISIGMSVVNIFTSEYILFTATCAFGLLCLLNTLAMRCSWIDHRIVYSVFGIESLALLAFFFITGIPNGFSALWVCLIPSFALLIFGIRVGSAFSALAFCMMVFLFWIPFGKTLLLYTYTEEFMLRFPFLYLSVYLISLLIEGIRRETQKQLELMKEKYSRLYRRDALTGLYNRYGIKEYLDKTFSSARTEQNRVAIILFDVDNFKDLNDRYGHECGDEVLKQIAAVPLRIMCSHCHCCRWGGEEFLLVMQCAHDPAVVAENIRREVEQTEILYNGARIFVTISVGVCIAESLSQTRVHDVIEKADCAMYASKKNGKNRVTVEKI